MIRRVLGSITNNISGFKEAAFWLSIFALLSQILALFRDRLLAFHFGANVNLDIYYSSFRVPDLIFTTVASLVSISVLIPIFAKRENEGVKNFKKTIDSIFTFFSLMIVIFCILAWIFMPFVVKQMFGFEAEKIDKIIFLSRMLLFSPLFLGISNFFGSIVQYQKRFILYSLSPVLYNTGIIAGIFFGAPNFGITGVVWGVLFGAFLHFLLPSLFVMGSNLKPNFTYQICWKDIFELIFISVPRTLALSVSTFVIFIFVALASRFQEGSVAIFNLAFNLQSAPLSLIGVSFSLATFPSMVSHFVKNNINGVIDNLSTGVRQIIFWSLPATAIVVVLRAHIVRVILGSGNFDWVATRLTSGVLAIFVLSTVFQSLQLFFSRSFYAIGKTKLPLIANLTGGIFAVFSAIFLMKENVVSNNLQSFLVDILDLSNLSTQILILPIAYFIGSLVSCLILWFAFGDLRHKIYEKIKPLFVANIIAFFVLIFTMVVVLRITNQLFDLNTFVGILLHGSLSGIVGIVCWFFVLRIMKNEEIMFILNK